MTWQPIFDGEKWHYDTDWPSFYKQGQKVKYKHEDKYIIATVENDMRLHTGEIIYHLTTFFNGVHSHWNVTQRKLEPA